MGQKGSIFMQCRKLQQLKTEKKNSFFATAEHRGDNWKLINEFMGFFGLRCAMNFCSFFMFLVNKCEHWEGLETLFYRSNEISFR